MQNEKRFWIGLSLLNLSVVALFGLAMRTKMLFPLPFLDYKNILNAHSHFAFGGWVGLALIAIFVYDVLPEAPGRRRIYRNVLWGIELSSIAMAISFPFLGYNLVTIVISTVFILVTYWFGWAFFKDLKRANLHPVVRNLSYGAVGSLMLSSIGPFSLAYMMASGTINSLLYRDSIYTFLHFQYNGFFTLAVFAAFFSYWIKKGFAVPPAAKHFATFLLLSVIPTLFLSMLWHKSVILFSLAATGCLFILISLYFFVPIFRQSLTNDFFRQPVARILWIAAFVSFILKMIMTIGTLVPSLGHAVYGARPVIIGFLHLVFLAFVSFYILSNTILDGFFSRRGKLIALPFFVFGTGVLVNEVFLMIQGLEVLLQRNNQLYNWLLWGGAILLFAGACLLATSFYSVKEDNKKAAVLAAAHEN